MKSEKKLNLLYFIGALLMLTIIGLGYSLLNNQSFSLISVSQAQYGEDGVPKWVIFATADKVGDGTTYVFTQNAKDLPNAQTSDGGTIVPQKDIKITVVQKESSCKYGLTNKDGWLGYDWGDNDMTIDAIVTRQSLLSISDGITTKEISAFEDGESGVEYSIENIDYNNNNGILKIKPVGGFITSTDCPSLSSYRIEYNDIENELNFYQGGKFSSNVNDAIGMVCKINILNDGTKNIGTKNEMICKINNKNIVIPSFTITADAKYLNFKYIPKTVGIPKIVEIIKPVSSVGENGQEGISLRIKNIGENSGTFVIVPKSQAFSFFPTSITEVFAKGEEREVSFRLYSPNVNQNFDFDGNFKVCSVNEVGASQCVNEDFTMTVKDLSVIDKIIPKDKICGNNFCDANENYLTCSVDCKEPVVCDGLNMQQYNNKCVCEEGFTMTTDDYGRDYCSEDKSNTILLIGIISLILAVVIIMIVIAKRRK